MARVHARRRARSGHDVDGPVVVAVVAVRMVQMPVHEIIHVVAVRHRLVPAARAVHVGSVVPVAVVCRRAGVGILR